MDIVSLRLSAMYALFGIITSNVRRMSIQEKNNLICLYFYYNHEPSEQEIELSEEAATNVIANFSEPFLIDCIRMVISYPQKITCTGYLIYVRFEE